MSNQFKQNKIKIKDKLDIELQSMTFERTEDVLAKLSHQSPLNDNSLQSNELLQNREAPQRSEKSWVQALNKWWNKDIEIPIVPAYSAALVVLVGIVYMNDLTSIITLLSSTGEESNVFIDVVNNGYMEDVNLRERSQ